MTGDAGIDGLGLQLGEALLENNSATPLASIVFFVENAVFS